MKHCILTVLSIVTTHHLLDKVWCYKVHSGLIPLNTVGRRNVEADCHNI